MRYFLLLTAYLMPSSEYHSKILSYYNCCLESYKFVLFLFTPSLNIGEGYVCVCFDCCFLDIEINTKIEGLN